MEGSIRFIHASDLHLGSLLHYTGENRGDAARIMATATFDAFARVCNAAIEKNVDFLVLSGDVFDSEAQSVLAIRFFVEQCSRLEAEGIPVYVISGNHDSSIVKKQILDLPANVYLFDSEAVQTCEVLNRRKKLIARILGQSYRGQADSRKMYSLYNPPDEGVWNIGLIHTQLDPGNTNYVPCSLDDLVSRNGIHYWALGHIHECVVLRDTYPVVAYSGIPQGRDFGEQGVGGCLLVELDQDSQIKLEFIPTSSIIWRRVEVKIDEDPLKVPKNISDLSDILAQYAERILDEPIRFPAGVVGLEKDLDNLVKGYIVQWIITGRGEIHEILIEQEQEVSSLLIDAMQGRFGHREPFLFTDSVKICTGKPVPSLEELGKESVVWQDLYEVINECLTDMEVQRELLGQLGQIWETVVDHERQSPYKFQVTSEVLKDLIVQAQQLIIEELLERRGLG